LEPVNLNADFELLKQSIANVLINAAQAVGFKGRIHIACKVENQSVKLSIQDNGPGIPEDIRDNVFKPFFTTKNTGTGLGLAMVKRVMEAHSGHIYFQSSASGTTFFIELPLMK
jgi:signal transduction histidine kinase